jgi:hypothetical protein
MEIKILTIPAGSYRGSGYGAVFLSPTDATQAIKLAYRDDDEYSPDDLGKLVFEVMFSCYQANDLRTGQVYNLVEKG